MNSFWLRFDSLSDAIIFRRTTETRITVEWRCIAVKWIAKLRSSTEDDAIYFETPIVWITLAAIRVSRVHFGHLSEKKDIWIVDRVVRGGGGG